MNMFERLWDWYEERAAHKHHMQYLDEDSHNCEKCKEEKLKRRSK